MNQMKSITTEEKWTIAGMGAFGIIFMIMGILTGGNGTGNGLSAGLVPELFGAGLLGVVGIYISRLRSEKEIDEK